jgi:AraC-like DNA-binding protein
MPDVARTLDLPPGQRFEYWKHVLSDTFVSLEVSSPNGDADFLGRPVAAVGARWGYPDPAHFSRLFKATYGMGPRDYRASHAPAAPDRRL